MTADNVYSLYHSGLYLCAGILAVYLLLRWASSHIGWLDPVLHPGRAHYVTAVLAVLAVIVVPASQGTTPNLQMLIAAVVGNVLLFLPGAAQPQKTLANSVAPPEPWPRADKPTQAGFIGRRVLIALGSLAVVITMACWSTVKKDASTVAADVIDCAKAESSAATKGTSVIAVAIDVAGTLVTIASGGDTAALEALVVKYGAPIVACTVAEIASRHPGIVAGSAAPTASEPDRLGVAARTVILEHRWRFKPAGGVQ